MIPAIYDLYTPGESDYSVLAARLQAAGIEVLYLGGYGPDAARIVRALRARGDNPQLVGGDGLGMDEFWTIAGADVRARCSAPDRGRRGYPQPPSCSTACSHRARARAAPVSAGTLRCRSGPRRSSGRVRSRSPP